MKTNLFSKVTAMGLAATMLFSTNVFATADVAAGTSGTTVTASSSVVNPVYKVKVPTTISFALDPFEIGVYATDSALNNRTMIKSAVSGYVIANQSNVPVKVNMEANLVLANNVFAVSAAAINTKTTNLTGGALDSIGETAVVKAKDEKNLEKEVSMYILLAKDAATTYNTTKKVDELTTIEYSKDFAYPLNVAEPGKKNVTASFVLGKGQYDAKGVYTALSATDHDGIAAFSFQGDINNKATWAANDVKVALKYTFEGLNKANFDDLDAKVLADTHRVVTAGGAYALTAPVKPTVAVHAAQQKKSEALAEPQEQGALAITNGAGYMKLDNTVGTTALGVKVTDATVATVLAPADYVIEWKDADKKDVPTKINLTTAGVKKLAGLTSTNADGSFTVALTVKNGRSVEMKFNFKPEA